MKNITASVVAFSLVLLTVSPSLAQKSRTLSSPVVASSAVPQTLVRAASDGNGVWISWESSIDSNERAFQIFRLDHKSAKPVNESPIPKVIGGQGFFDREGTLGSTYILESINSSGDRGRVAQVPVDYVPDLSAETGGRSSARLAEIGGTAGVYTSYQFGISPDVAVGIDPGIKPTNAIIQRMVAAQPGVKLGIKKDGFYRVTRAQLSAAGFNVNSDHTKWQLFLDGIEQAIIVEAAGNHIEFYAKGKEVIESDTRYLFLINGTVDGRRMTSRVPSDSGAQTIASGYDQSFLLKQRTNYIYDIINGETDNWWGAILSTLPTNITFDLSGIDTSAATALVTIKFQGFVGANHSVNATLNGQPVGNFVGTYTNPFGGEATIPTSALVEGANTLTLTGAAGSFPLFDSLEIGFKRNFNANQNRSTFYTLANRRAVIGNFSSANVRIFDVTIDGEPKQVTNLNVVNNGLTFAINFPAHRARIYHAVEDSGIQQVHQIIPNAPSTLSTPGRNGQLVIITWGGFAAQAEAWANYRRGQGMPVEVVDIADVYDEFNFGMSTSRSITDFLKYARNTWQTPPQYVLLLGDASYDPKDYLGFGNQNLVPTKMVSTVYLETGSDESLADFNNDGLAEMAVGRIPAKTAAEVTQSLNKTMTFETPAMQNMNRGAIFAFDEPNGYNFEAMSQMLAAEFPASVPKLFVNRLTSNSNQILVNDINVGRYLANYSGHGTTGNWYGSSFFGQNNFRGVAGVPQVANGNNLTIFTMLTCLNGYFMNPYFDSLSEIMQKHNNGGSVANWSSTGLTTPDVQLVMGLRFFNQLSAGNMTRIGDLIKDAKGAIPGGSDVRLSWVLIGDPTLKVRP